MKMGRRARRKIPYLYKLWDNVKQRCYNKLSREYRNYGARGIRMYSGWINDYPAFKAYIEAELGPRPEGYSFDRKDNDGHYLPGNVRWASAREQAANKRPPKSVSWWSPSRTRRFGPPKKRQSASKKELA